VSKQIEVKSFIVTRSRGGLDSMNLIKALEHGWMVGIKAVIDHVRIVRILINIIIFWFVMPGISGSCAMVIVTTIIKGTMVSHFGFGVIEDMNVRKDIIIVYVVGSQSSSEIIISWKEILLHLHLAIGPVDKEGSCGRQGEFDSRQ
jgi:hypothetical protein